MRAGLIGNQPTTSNRNLRPAWRVGVGAVAALLALGACGSQQVSKTELADQVSKSLGESVGFEPESVTCPKGLKAEVGAEARCTLSDRGQKFGVTVEVTEVKGSDVKFDVEVDEEPAT